MPPFMRDATTFSRSMQPLDPSNGQGEGSRVRNMIGRQIEERSQMKKLSVLLGVGALAAAAFTAAPGVASAASTTYCDGVLAPGTYQRVVVPADAVCLSDGPVVIRSGLFVQQGATFVL